MLLEELLLSLIGGALEDVHGLGHSRTLITAALVFPGKDRIAVFANNNQSFIYHIPVVRLYSGI